MKSLLCFACLTLSAFASPGVPTSTLPQPAPLATENPAAQPAVAGHYAGTWQGGQDAGELRFKLSQVGGGEWSVDAVFTFQGEEIPTKVRSVKVDGAKVEFVLGWEVQGTPGHSRMTGQSASDRIDGIYESQTPDGVTNGTWTVTRA